MRHWLRFLFATTGILACTAAISAAAADTYRVPQTGNPALVADAPPGWTGQRVGQNEVVISSPGEMAVVELSIISDPATAAKPLPEVAAEVFDSAPLPRWTSSEPASVAGLPGQAFITTVDRGTPVLVRVIIAKIDANHVATVKEITMPKGTTPEQLSGLNGIVSHLSISGR